MFSHPPGAHGNKAACGVEPLSYHQATSFVVARLKVVAWRPALRPVIHASLDATSDTALHFTKRSYEFWFKKMTADGKNEGLAISCHFLEPKLITADG